MDLKLTFLEASVVWAVLVQYLYIRGIFICELKIVITVVKFNDMSRLLCTESI